MPRQLSDNRYEEIKKEVVFMYEECDIHEYPIDCFKIAKKLHYVLVPYSSLSQEEYRQAYNKDPDGYSVVEENPKTGMFQYVIYYNDQDVLQERIRWTIFHEIGHCYLGHHDNSGEDSLTEEAEANFFAKYAIAPPPLVFNTDCKDPYDVANKFNLSFDASRYSFKYFKTWLVYRPSSYLPYEIQLLGMFNISTA